MADYISIQRHIDRGSGIAASKLGQPCSWFRPFSSVNPIAPAAQMGTINVFLDPDFQFGGKKPNLYGKPTWGALFDRTNTRPGDYLVLPDGSTFFLIAQQSLMPSAAVECNAVLSVTRAGGVSILNEDNYGGRTVATDVALMTLWPGSVIRGGRTIAGKADLPGDTQDGGYGALLPLWPGANIRTSDLVTAADGRTFTVSVAELSDLGWRLILTMSVT